MSELEQEPDRQTNLQQHLDSIVPRGVAMAEPPTRAEVLTRLQDDLDQIWADSTTIYSKGFGMTGMINWMALEYSGQG